VAESVAFFRTPNIQNLPPSAKTFKHRNKINVFGSKLSKTLGNQRFRFKTIKNTTKHKNQKQQQQQQLIFG
jgi:hypothetical protein